jgi:hypothetical protein
MRCPIAKISMIYVYFGRSTPSPHHFYMKGIPCARPDQVLAPTCPLSPGVKNVFASYIPCDYVLWHSHRGMDAAPITIMQNTTSKARDNAVEPAACHPACNRTGTQGSQSHNRIIAGWNHRCNNLSLRWNCVPDARTRIIN